MAGTHLVASQASNTHLPCPPSGTEPGQFAPTAHGIHLGRIKGDYTIYSCL